MSLDSRVANSKNPFFIREKEKRSKHIASKHCPTKSKLWDGYLKDFEKVWGRPPSNDEQLKFWIREKRRKAVRDRNRIIWDHDIYRRKDGKRNKIKAIYSGEPLRFGDVNQFNEEFEFFNWNEKSPRFSEQPPNTEWVYFLGATPHADRADEHPEIEVVPLYIGKTSNLWTRLQTHRRNQFWWDNVDFIWTIPLPKYSPDEGIWDASSYEKWAIKRFRPVFSNEIKRKKQERRQPPVAILRDIQELRFTSMNGDDWFEYYTGEDGKFWGQ